MKLPALPKKLFINSKGVLAISTIACLLSLPAVQAADFGHARLDTNSKAGLDVRIPINNLTAADMDVLVASAAPADQWQANGLTPPVDIASMQFNVLQSGKSGSSVLQVTSDQAYKDSVIDLLLNIQTAAGVEPYQVSLIVPPPSNKPVTSQASNTSNKNAIGSISVDATKNILVKRGDNMFAIAKRNAVDGVSVYQLMMALHRTNPNAFIKNNVNLVKAGANLSMPSVQEMLSISDAEARRQFVAHTNALSSPAGVAAATADVIAATTNTDSGTVTVAQDTPKPAAESVASDKVRLGAPTISDTQVAEQHALKDTKVRVSQLEDNVRNLNQALQSQGRAASDAVSEGARALNESINQLSDTISGVASDSNDLAADAGNSAAINNTSNSNTADGLNSINKNGSTSKILGSNQGSSSANNSADSTGSGIGINIESKDAANTNSAAVNSASASNSAISSGDEANSALTQAGGAADQTSTSKPSSANTDVSSNSSNTENSWIDWASDHLLGVIISILAIIVLLIIWVLRKMTSDNGIAEPMVTPDMLQEKLDEIDLNLESDKTIK